MSIICVRITERGFPGKESVSHVVGEEVLQFPSKFLEHVNQSAKELTQSGSSTLTYCDDDGDSCTLTEATVQDALCFLKNSGSEGHPQILELEVFVKTQAQVSPETDPNASTELPRSMPAADSQNEWAESDSNQGDPNRRGWGGWGGCRGSQWSHWNPHRDRVWYKGGCKTGHKGGSTGVDPTHYGVVCDGCGQTPILGLRHKSLEKENYDLCGACYSRGDRETAFSLQPGHKFEVVQPLHCPLMEMAKAFSTGKGLGKACGKGFGKACGKGFGTVPATAEVIHQGVTCDGCGISPVVGVRFKSLEWDDYDLCAECHAREDRQSTLGVSSEHHFKSIPMLMQNQQGANLMQNIVQQMMQNPEQAMGMAQHMMNQAGGAPGGLPDAQTPSIGCNPAMMLALLENFQKIDVSKLLPKVAGAFCSIVHKLGEDALFPLLELFAPLAQQEQCADWHAHGSLVQSVLEIASVADWKVQKKFWKQCGKAIHAVLIEAGIDNALISGPVRALVRGLGKGLGKGFGKAFGKGCKSAGKGKGKGGRCFRNLAKGFFKAADGTAEDSSSDDAPPPSTSNFASASSVSVREKAFMLLLQHSDEAIRSAAEIALQQAHSKDQQPQEETIQNQQSHDSDGQTDVVILVDSERSAVVIGAPTVDVSCPSLLFDSSLSGDATGMWAQVLSQFPLVNQAYSLGHISWHQSLPGAEFSVATLHVKLVNNGQQNWPEETALRIAAGNAFGLDEIMVGAVAQGKVVELAMHLVLPSSLEPGRSTWALEVNGQPFGPLMILETS